MNDDMLDNVLKNKFIDAINLLGPDLSGLQFRLPFLVIAHFLGKEWVAEKIILSQNPDPFMLNEFDENSENRFTYMSRVDQLGNNLFHLRNLPSLDILIERLKVKDTRPTFYEASIASHLKQNNFIITIKKEENKRGKDFDFIASNETESIEIEVTEKKDGPLNTNNIMNTLKYKRSQFSGDKAAILYIIIPFSWAQKGKEAESIIRNTTHQFFEGTCRINAVVYVYELPMTLGEGRVVASVFVVIKNQRARIKISNTDFLDESPLKYKMGDTVNIESFKSELSTCSNFAKGSILHWCWEQDLLPDKLSA